MSDKQQSAVDWLFEQLTEVDYNCINKTFLQNNNSMAGYKLRELFDQAKELFKQQIIDARTPIISFLNQIEQQELRNEAEKYFNQTFKTESNE